MERQEQNKRTAERRVNRVYKALRAWGDLSAARYGLEEPEVNAMHAAIEDCLAGQRQRFHEQKTFCFAEGDDGCDSTTGDREDRPTE